MVGIISKNNVGKTSILEACYSATQARGYTGPSMLHMGGFTPWWYKYTKDGPGCPHCKHKGVETEWETMGIVPPPWQAC